MLAPYGLHQTESATPLNVVRLVPIATIDDGSHGLRGRRVPRRREVNAVVTEITRRVRTDHLAEFVHFDADPDRNATESYVVSLHVGIVAIWATPGGVPLVVDRRRRGKDEPLAS